MESLSPRIDLSTISSMLTYPLPPSILHTYRLSSFGCGALCIVISIFVLWSICLCSSYVHLKKCFAYISRWTIQGLIYFLWFFLPSLLRKVLHSSDVLFSKFFLSFLLVWCYPLSIFSSTCNFPWGCADQCSANNFSLFSLCGFFYVLLETVSGIQAINRSPPSSVQLGFSTS